ncbi:MAG TPA: hypothetical protein VGG28_01155 [Kofleriaceae bacterium]|jgi:hypothetical protein
MRAAVLTLLLVASSARAEPSDTTLVLVGAGMAIPDYVAGVSLHESSHALAAILLGAHVDTLHVFPPGVDPQARVFRFGWTYVHGLKTQRDTELFLLAPKFTDAILLGGFAALVFTSAWPSNKYGELALTVAATGLWVDFAKDVVVVSPQDDVVRVLHMWCADTIAARAVYAVLDLGLALIVAKGYERTFTRDAPAMAMPLFRTAF